ncbi:MAG TPA: D-alanyl-D-alanine carboxypeptidase, partial [Armatimonadetes bacterium]|nr:D-alanyl-D-alanine carboxypeptidase [Armatimonadota bacterium]
NPHGLHDSPHYTTAYDIARIARYALQYPLFRKVVATREWRLPATNKAPARAFRNRNQLLWSYPGADGVKTGFTVEAGRCLVATATRGGWQLMAVVMKSNDAFHDATQLLNYGFERFVSLPVARSSAPVVTLHVANASPSTITVVSLYDWFVVVPRDALRKVRWTIHEKPIKPPIQRGAVVAWMEVYAPGYSTHWLPLVTQQPVNWSREYLRRRALLRAGGLAIAILFMVILMVGKRRRSVSKKRMPSTTDFKW